MNKKAACSLTFLFFEKKIKPVWLDEFLEPTATIIGNYKKALQILQLTILEGDPKNHEEIGNYLVKLENHFDTLISTLKQRKEKFSV